ncbi:hypothetical protein CPB83DRAFT_830819 [Crepidotus variabilis]|uniref:Cytochrome c oxidase assembly factor 3 n=1 Tax=Crepidotus variabilis TaxID=179855 RepID=A0A9P6ER93_9AGAR|nr:hypothetical protein CPB83DRAFT_830819 [Crepidotus variabilis]
MNQFQAPYVDKREAAKSYRPKAGTMSPGLKRAREPYRLKNAVVGIALGAFAVGVWAYSISAVKQDVFDDVDEEVEALGAGLVGITGTKGSTSIPNTPNTSIPTSPVVAAAITTSASGMKSSPVLDEVARVTMPPRGACPVRGVLPRWERHLPGWVGSRLLDPQRKTLVWGAPPVDNPGKMGGRS